MATNEEKFKRWKDFALRMAKVCFSEEAEQGHPSPEWIVKNIDWFFDELDPIGEYSWDDDPHYICDRVSNWVDEIWYQPYNYATEKEVRVLDKLHDRGKYGIYDELKAKIADRWESPLHCCIRSGVDFAYEPSVGVLGYTAGDLRAMYPEGVPDWISSQWEKDGKPVNFAEILDDAGLIF